MDRITQRSSLLQSRLEISKQLGPALTDGIVDERGGVVVSTQPSIQLHDLAVMARTPGC